MRLPISKPLKLESQLNFYAGKFLLNAYCMVYYQSLTNLRYSLTLFNQPRHYSNKFMRSQARKAGINEKYP